MTASLTTHYATRHALTLGPLVAARCHRLRHGEKLSQDEWVCRQEGLLRRTLQHAARVIPAYRSLLGHIPQNRLIEFLRTLPLVDRAKLLSARQDYYPHGGDARPWWSVGKTSGTTGTPLDIFRSYDSVLWEQAFCRQHWAWAGWSAGERQVVLRGDLVVPVEQTSPPFWFYDRFGAQLLVSSRHVNRHTVAAIAQAITAHAPAQLRAYPSAAYNLAVLLREQGLRVLLRSIITGSETLLPVQRQTIESVFGARVFDHYGMAERVAFGMECEHGRLHVHPQYSFVEIVDAAGRNTDGPGFVVGTTFHNQVMPLVRYRLNDMAQWGQGECPCGRTYPHLLHLGGKVEDQLYDRDRQAVSASVVTFAFKGVPLIAKAQVAQVDAQRWVIRIVPLPGFSADEQGLLLTNFKTLVSNRVDTSIQLLEDIPAQASGKYKWISQEYYTAARGGVPAPASQSTQ
jgi:phenylacetate-CoA ligase